jgi:hypothetical protein
MNVYIQRLKAQQQAADQAVIDELEQHSAPLALAIKAAMLAVILGGTGSALSGHVEQYIRLAANQEAMVQCMNGKTIGLNKDAVMRCSVYEINTKLAEVRQ